MSRRLHNSVRIALLVALTTLGGFAEDRYLVKVNGDVNAVAKRYGLTVVKSLAGSGSGRHVLSSKGTLPITVLRNLSAEFAVRSAESEKPVRLPGIKPATAVHPSGAPAGSTRFASTLIRYHDTYASSAYVNQPATDVINMDRAHTLATGKGTVATIDTGVDFTHSVLRGSLTPGWDFIHDWPLGQEMADLNQETTPILDQETTPILDQETTPILDGGSAVILQQETTPILDQETTPILDGKKFPAYGHGTMVAGLIHLIAPDAKIMPLRAFGADGSATISQIVAAIYYAVDHNADVINMSFSVTQDSPALREALEYAASKGLVLVASAGNDGQATQVWPAAYATVMGIASTNNQKIRSLFSNYGNSLVTLAAPGEGIITLYPKEHYAQVWGTSFSAPMVAGAAALLLDMNSRTDEGMAVSALSHATAIGQELGAGELDLYQAVLAAKKK
ncbi:MAG: S8 family serine peptidase [Candidatus Solibacter sp.]